jgi:hypothetical protein
MGIYIYILIIPLKGHKREKLEDWGVSESFFVSEWISVNRWKLGGSKVSPFIV